MARCLKIEHSNAAHWIGNLFNSSEIPLIGSDFMKN